MFSVKSSFNWLIFVSVVGFLFSPVAGISLALAYGEKLGSGFAAVMLVPSAIACLTHACGVVVLIHLKEVTGDLVKPADNQLKTTTQED